jgi:hypothetical protein
MPRGWTTVGLALVDEHERLWTVADAARFLGKDADDVRWLIRSLEIQPVGMQRKTGHDRRGRQPRVYRAIDLIRAYDALSKVA